MHTSNPENNTNGCGKGKYSNKRLKMSFIINTKDDHEDI